VVDLQTTAIIPDIQILVPDVRLVNDPPGPARLEWRSSARKTSPSLQSCLWQFIELAEAPDEAIRAFAQTWGVLGLGSDGRPHVGASNELLSDKHRFWESAPTTLRQRATKLEEEDGVWHWEPLSAWRFFSRRMRALLAIAVDLRTQVPTKMEDWLDAARPLKLPRSPADLEESFSRSTVEDFAAFQGLLALSDGLSLRSPTDQRRIAHFLANELIERSGLFPALIATDGSEPQIGVAIGTIPEQEARSSLGGSDHRRAIGVYNVLAGQFLAALQSPRTFHCSVCGKSYLLGVDERRPREDRKNFCSSECRYKARLEVRKASERHRSRKRKEEQEG
jgi:hypothetical protein